MANISEHSNVIINNYSYLQLLQLLRLVSGYAVCTCGAEIK